MKVIRQLRFAQPTADAFVDVLRPLWERGEVCTRLIGDNALTAAIAEATARQGIAFERGQLSEDGASDKTHVIVITETDGEKLSDLLLSCIDYTNVVVLAPITDWHFSHKPLFLVSIPKAGTHLLYELAEALGYRPGVELPDSPRGQTWYCVEYSNSHTLAKDFFVESVRRAPFGNRHHIFPHTPTLFIYRHPLDILVSEAHYYHRDGKTAFAGYLSQYGFEERVTRLLNDTWLAGSLRERIGGFLPWLEFPNVIPLSFEELVGAEGGGFQNDQLDLIWSLQLKLQAPGDAIEIASHVFNTKSATFREGRIGGYVNQLSPAEISNFATQNRDILEQLGYPMDGSPSVPSKAAPHRHQAIRYSKVDYVGMPFTIESEFLGCNLVQYRRLFFAVPLAAGPLAIDQLPPGILADLPVASTLPELKSLLLNGNTRIVETKEALDQLAKALRAGASDPAVHRYWSESAKPFVFEEYKGFNLVLFRGRYFGLRRSVGAVDLTEDLAALAQRFDLGDVLISTSLSSLRLDIDGLSVAQRARAECAEMQEQIYTVRQQMQDISSNPLFKLFSTINKIFRRNKTDEK